MESQNSTQTESSKIPLIGGTVILLVIIGFGVFGFLSKSSEQFKVSVPTSPDSTEKKEESKSKFPKFQGKSLIPSTRDGSYQIGLKDSTTVKVGQPVKLLINADSKGKDIVAFDVILNYDTAALTMSKAVSSVAGFSVFQKDIAGSVAITAFKGPEKTEKTVFQSTQVLEISVTPKKIGLHKIALQPNMGNATAKMVDVKTTVLYPTVNSVTLNVQ